MDDISQKFVFAERDLEAQIIFVSHSGGKDSQAMLAYIHSLNLNIKIVVVHSDLGEMEWEPMHNFISKNSFGYEFHVIQPKNSFFYLCQKYKRLPSGQARFCTDQLKTKPIMEFILDYCRKNGVTSVINATGIRAEESPSRAKKSPWQKSKMSRKDVLVWDWMPIFNYKLSQVWAEINNVGQTCHEIYSKGFSRLSCVFCVFGKIEEHKKAAKLKPELYQKMVLLEKELSKTIRLKQVKGVKLNKFLDEYCG